MDEYPTPLLQPTRLLFTLRLQLRCAYNPRHNTTPRAAPAAYLSTCSAALSAGTFRHLTQTPPTNSAFRLAYTPWQSADQPTLLSF